MKKYQQIIYRFIFQRVEFICFWFRNLLKKYEKYILKCIEKVVDFVDGFLIDF